jgi:hypothetical protein
MDKLSIYLEEIPLELTPKEIEELISGLEAHLEQFKV